MPIVLGLQQTKSFTSPLGDFKAVCTRTEAQPNSFTRCTLELTDLEVGGIVTISKRENKISGVFSEEIARAFVLPQELMISPDKSLTICSICGMDGAGLPFSIVWKKLK